MKTGDSFYFDGRMYECRGYSSEDDIFLFEPMTDPFTGLCALSGELVRRELAQRECSSIPLHTHEWKKYVGFTEVFDYCDCGEKRK